MKETYSILLIVLLSLFSKKTSGQDVKDNFLPANDIKLNSIDFNIIKFDSDYDYIFPSTFKATDLSEDEIILIEILLRKMIVQYNIDAEKRFIKMDSKFPKYGLKLKTLQLNLMTMADNLWL